MILRHLLSALCLLVLAAGAAAAEPLAKPAGPVVLTVRGAIARDNGDGAARFDMAMLQALPKTGFATKTPWTQGPHRFEGVLLRDLLNGLGAHGEHVRARALDDYEAVLPWTDIAGHQVLLAYAMDGKPMDRGDKGPLWIVYPLDRDPALQAGKVQDRMVWQLRELQVE